MTAPEPAPTFAGLINITATAHATHPEGANLSELPDPNLGDDNENTETH
jgi:hypothetical protein